MISRGKPIRVGLILDSLLQPEWIGSFIEQLCATQNLQLAAILLEGSSRTRHLIPLLLRLWIGLERWCSGQSGSSAAQELKIPAQCVIRLDQMSPMGPSNTIFTEGLDLDVLVHFGRRQPPEQVLDHCEYGVWEVQYDGYDGLDPEHALLSILYAGFPTCELALRSFRTGSCNQVLYRSSFSTHKALLYKNFFFDRQRRSQILLRRLHDLSDRGWNSLIPEKPRKETARENHRITTGALFLARWVARCLRHAFSKLWFEEQWIIACSKDKSSVAQLQPSSQKSRTIIAPPPGQNYADPFLFVRNGRAYMFFERWYTSQPGVIWCTELGSDGVPVQGRQVLARDYHLSYPFVFELRGETYMIPETQQNKTVETYRAVEFPWRWEPAAVLLKDVTAVDPTILEYQGKLWLFVAGVGGTAMNSSELSLFFADSLFGDWQPHPKNPIACDVRRARPAGALLKHGNELIRPGQDCSTRYGHAITLNRVQVLSETDYRELPFATILPNWMPGICATHTVNRSADMEVLDAKTRVPRYTSLLRRIMAPMLISRQNSSLFPRIASDTYL